MVFVSGGYRDGSIDREFIKVQISNDSSTINIRWSVIKLLKGI